mmetsp:Transcript_61306/g.99253  ORF Transcript_61306/g.99253 Transcript_61306/m.99253 type:complete len:319 (-) Transcript_61306:326-1282(-)
MGEGKESMVVLIFLSLGSPAASLPRTSIFRCLRVRAGWLRGRDKLRLDAIFKSYDSAAVFRRTWRSEASRIRLFMAGDTQVVLSSLEQSSGFKVSEESMFWMASKRYRLSLASTSCCSSALSRIRANLPAMRALCWSFAMPGPSLDGDFASPGSPSELSAGFRTGELGLLLLGLMDTGVSGPRWLYWLGASLPPPSISGLGSSALLSPCPSSSATPPKRSSRCFSRRVTPIPVTWEYRSTLSSEGTSCGTNSPAAWVMLLVGCAFLSVRPCMTCHSCVSSVPCPSIRPNFRGRGPTAAFMLSSSSCLRCPRRSSRWFT